ncbi:DUF86 domain-containing protein [Candidatus Pacearchaeota archaeon]|nr:DUF86 domain-containing protein [Candidatus Pacearchaeota archaeon]
MRKSRNYKLFLGDIKECLDKLEEYTKGVSKEQFKEDTKLQDAVIRRLEIIGEAVKNIPKSVRDINKSFPWEELSNFKNILIHSYFEVGLDRIWGIVVKRITYLKEELKTIKLL